MSRRATPSPKALRRVERWLVGLAMGVVAFLLERIVVRGLKKKGQKTEPDLQPTTLTSRGGSVDLDE